MKVFTNRYDRIALRDISFSQRNIARYPSSDAYNPARNLLSDKLRTRLNHLLRYITSGTNFLEPFMLIRVGNSDRYEIYTKSLKDFSDAEIGYDITENLNTDTMEIHKFNDEGEKSHDDPKLLDLLEILVVLSKDEIRTDLIRRFNDIFKDESSTFAISGWMVIPTNQSGLSPLIPLIKNPTLKEKLNSLRSINGSLSAQAKARNAADAVQYIFSSDVKGKTKNETEQLLTNIAMRWTEPEKVDDLYELMNRQVLLAKEFNNEIGNIRHTDRHTISIEGPGMFELIYKINMSIVELAIVTEQEKYIEEKTASEIKNGYSKNYQIDLGQAFKRKLPDEPIDLSEIPF